LLSIATAKKSILRGYAEELELFAINPSSPATLVIFDNPQHATTRIRTTISILLQPAAAASKKLYGQTDALSYDT
jgi:hypothetical protein